MFLATSRWPSPPPARRVVHRVADPLELVLVGELVRDVAERLAQAVPLAGEDGLGDRQGGVLLPGLQLGGHALVDAPGRRHRLVLGHAGLVRVGLLGLVDHVHDPGADRLHQDLGALALEEREHAVVAVALGGLGPELARDLDDGLHPRAVDVDRAEPSRWRTARASVYCCPAGRRELAQRSPPCRHGGGAA